MSKTPLKRLKLNYEDKNSKFFLTYRRYDRQYAHLYASRLSSFRMIFNKIAEEKCKGEIPMKKLSQLAMNEKCAVVGTLFKRMIYKPNVLKEISEENQLQPQPKKMQFTDSSDTLFLEDEVQRIILKGNFKVEETITGTVVMVVGYQIEKGTFFAEEIIYKNDDFEKEDEIIKEIQINEGPYVVLLSGLAAGGIKTKQNCDQNEKNGENLFHLQLLADLLTGCLGDESIQTKMSKVGRVIIAGNLFGDVLVDKEIVSHGKMKKQNKQQTLEEENEMKNVSDLLDNFLFQLGLNLDVDVMPGSEDPTTYCLPQQPFHPCLFPRASSLSSIHLVTNPYHSIIENRHIIGSSGQPVNDVMSVSSFEEPLQVLKYNLKVGHLAPSAPDTLSCVPFKEEDPFIISERPHVLFSANHSSFSYNLIPGKYHSTLTIAVPHFFQTHTVVLIDLKSLQCTPINICI